MTTTLALVKKALMGRAIHVTSLTIKTTLRPGTQQMKHLFSVVRLTTTGAARSVLLKFEERNGQPGKGRNAWLALKNKYSNTSHRHRPTILRQLDKSVIR